MKIKSNSPMRKTVADQSGYYDNKAAAIIKLEAEISYYGYRFYYVDLPDNQGNSLVGCLHHTQDNEDEPQFFIYASWYRMESGRYEFTFYVT